MLLIYRIYIYNSRRSESSTLESLIREIAKVKNVEEKVSINNKKNKIFTSKNGSKLKMFWRLKLFDTLSDSVSDWGEDKGRSRE